jgi:WD40 repeat protein
MHAKQVWDLRKVEVSMTLKGHSDTITGLRVSPDGTHLLSNAMVSLCSALHLTNKNHFPLACLL